MNILVTGGAGYIGSAAAETLINAGHRVTVYDSLVSGYRAAVPDGADFIQADVGETVALEAALGEGKYDAIMHFAAFIEAGESMKDPGKFLKNNLANSLTLIDAAARHGVNRFVLSSTAAVYATSDVPLDEDSAIDPANTYGFSKLAVEGALEWYRRIHGLHFAALRYFNACGALPGRGEAHDPESHLIPLVLKVALGQREAVQVYGNDYLTPDGTCIRDYIHISDLISAHLLTLDALEKKGYIKRDSGSRGIALTTPTTDSASLPIAGTVRAGALSPAETKSYRGAAAPTLRQALRFTRDHNWHVNMEIKDLQDTPGNPQVVHKVAALLEELDMVDRVLVSSFNHRYLKEVCDRNPRIATGALVSKSHPDPESLLHELGAQAYHPSVTAIRRREITRLRKKGFQVNVWTVNDPGVMRSLIRVGASGIFTDYPQLLRPLLAEGC
ncbi:MAG: UDP-glucose 4-epimerase GalE [Syntrophobacteraceae bacterium]|nr:UDP-glucose 4-epimerase GalE [Syntrophobacteraceae bacterium]